MRLLGDMPTPEPLSDPELDLLRLRASARAEPIVIRRFVLALIPVAMVVFAFIASIAWLVAS